MADDGNGMRVRLARQAAIMTQEHLAAAAGVSAKTIARMERGNETSAETLRAVGAVLGINFSSASCRDQAVEPGPADAGWFEDRVLGESQGWLWQQKLYRLWKGKERTSFSMASRASRMLDNSGVLTEGNEAAHVLREALARHWSDSTPVQMDTALAANGGDKVAAWG